MTDAPEAGAIEARAGLPDVIQLPDQSRRPAKTRRSGSAKRHRHHIEQFRTDDAEHEALHAKARASGLSLGAYIMQLASIAGGPGARSRRRAHASLDHTALMHGLVAFNREHNNYNQAVKALNTLVLVADDRSSDRLIDEISRLRRDIERLQEQFAAPLAAILGAVRDDREG